jgi:predicted DNA-binding protein
MTNKLTLSIKKETVEKAKRLSSKTGKSLSKIVQEHFDAIISKAEASNASVIQLSGALKKKASVNASWKEIKANHIQRKYGI